MTLPTRPFLSPLVYMLLLAAGGSSALRAQTSVDLSDADITRFPLVSARFFATDAARSFIMGLTAADVVLTENGIAREVVALHCPDTRVMAPLTCGVMVDTYRYLDIAEAGLRRIIARLQMPPSELGVTTMDRGVFIIQDLTIDPRRALTAASRLISSPGSHLQQIMYDPNAGGVPFVSGRPNRKALVLFTDLHCPDFGLDTSRLWADAAREQISVYTILLHAGDYFGLFERIGERTGGRLFEHVTSIEQVERIVDQIALEMQYEPCTLEWRSDSGCDSVRVVTASLPSRGGSGSISYLLPTRDWPRLSAAPAGVFFNAVAPGDTRDTAITITSGVRAVALHSFSSDDPAFSIPGLPVTIPAGTSHDITLRYTAVDVAPTFARITLDHDACDPMVLYASAGTGITPAPTLKVLSPNGGEILSAGQSVLLTWTGVLPTDTVDLDYSTDDGDTWLPIAKRVAGLEYLWRVRNTPSDRCLLRVRLLPQDVQPIMLRGHRSSLLWGVFSPDGRNVVTTSGDSEKGVWIWDAISGRKIGELEGHRGPVRQVLYTPDGGRIVTCSDDLAIRVFDASTGTPGLTIPDAHVREIWAIAISPDGRYLVSAALDQVKIREMATGALVDAFTCIEQVSSIGFSPDGKRVVLTVGRKAEVWEINPPKVPVLLARTIDNSQSLRCAAFDPSGGRFVTGSRAPQGNVRVWDATSGALIATPAVRPLGITTAVFDPTGEKILAAGRDNLAIITNAIDGTEIQRLRGHRGIVYSACYSSDAQRVLTTSGDSTAMIRYVGAPQEDSSDARWTIVAPRLEIPVTEVDMGVALVHGARDSIVMAVLCNRGSAPIHIAGIDPTSGDVGDFSILTGGGEFTLDPGECRDIQFMFSPMMAMRHDARFSIRLDDSVVADVIHLFGVGQERKLELAMRSIDFGALRVGTTRDTVVDLLLRNSGSVPFTIDAGTLLGPDTVQFGILSGGGSFTLAPGAVRAARIRFAPVAVGKTSGRVAFHYSGPGSPATVSLFGEGIGPEILLTADSIPFAPLLCGSERDSAVMIYNSGNADLTIGSLGVDGAGTTGFRLDLPDGVSSPIVLAPRSSVRGIVRYSPVSAGPAISSLRIRSDALNAVAGETVVPIRGNRETTGLEVSVPRVEMSDLFPGDRATATFDLTNKGSIPLVWTSPFALGPHTIEIVPSVTPPGGVSTVTVGFPGGVDGDLFLDTLRLATVCDTTRVPVIAAVTSVASAELVAGEASAEAGDIVEIPIILRDPRFIQRTGTTGFETNLRFNASMLLPVEPTPMGTVVDGERIIPLAMPAEASSDGTLLWLRFHVALGNDTITTLTLEHSRPVGGKVAVRERAGSFHLAGVCLSGGARLLNAGDGIMLKVLPNLVTSTVGITINAVESGTARITLGDQLGRTVAVAFDGEMEPGLHHFGLDLSQLESGVYYCVFRTATMEVVEQVRVVK